MLKDTSKKPQIIIILGPTATGKSDLAVKIARNLKKSRAEIISADSRQVYKGLDLGTGKITKKEMLGIPHHLLDVVSPKKVFSVADWQRLTKEKIEEILARGNTPIICGGTGFYIQSIVDDVVLPEVSANQELRKELAKKSVNELFSILKKLDSNRAKNIAKEQGDKNPVRLIRAIEIATTLGKVPKIKKIKNKKYNFIEIGLDAPDEILKQKIHKRLVQRIKKGMILEAKNLHKTGLSYKRMRELGLEYRSLADFIENRISKQELIENLNTKIWQYVRRQRQWFKRDKNIKWFIVSKDTNKEICEYLHEHTTI